MLEIPPDDETKNRMIADLNKIKGESRSSALIISLYVEYLIMRRLQNLDM